LGQGIVHSLAELRLDASKLGPQHEQRCWLRSSGRYLFDGLVLGTAVSAAYRQLVLSAEG
jgi:hypothetical protein